MQAMYHFEVCLTPGFWSWYAMMQTGRLKAQNFNNICWKVGCIRHAHWICQNHVCIHAGALCIYTHILTCTCTCIYACVCVLAYMYVKVYLFISVCMYVCVCVCEPHSLCWWAYFLQKGAHSQHASGQHTAYKYIISLCKRVCVCSPQYTYTHTCVYVCLCACMYPDLIRHVYVCMCVCVHVKEYVWMYVLAYLSTYVCIYVCIYVCMDVCMYVCMLFV